jgi:hypothetical protein
MLRAYAIARRSGGDCRLVEDWNGDAVANACNFSVMEISAHDEPRLWPVNETLPMFPGSEVRLMPSPPELVLVRVTVAPCRRQGYQS